MAASATAAPLLLAEAGTVVPVQHVQASPESSRRADSLRNEGECRTHACDNGSIVAIANVLALGPRGSKARLWAFFYRVLLGVTFVYWIWLVATYSGVDEVGLSRPPVDAIVGANQGQAARRWVGVRHVAVPRKRQAS